MDKKMLRTRVLYDKLRATLINSFDFLYSPHFKIEQETGALVLFDYDEQTREEEIPILGNLFFLTFFPLWLFSIISGPLVLYYAFRGSWIPLLLFSLLAVYTYSPVPRRSSLFRLFAFLNVPKYFHKASFRILSPDKFVEYKLLKDSLQAPISKVSPYPAWHILAVRKTLRSLTPPCRVWLFHPHGLLCTGWGLQAFNPYVPNNEMCISTLLYHTPPVICYTSHCGKPSPVSARAVKNHLKARRSLSIILGGFDEAAIHPNSGDRLFIRHRKGIFKYAIEYGCELVPVFVFGETQSYKNIQGLWKLRLWLTQRGIPAMFPWGRKIGYMPKNEMLHVVVGDPISVAAESPVTSEMVDDLHGRYVTALNTLYEKWKGKFYGKDYPGTLEMW
eukprot:Gregarina_sp_Pseudo_9__5778@NODE_85_length_4430_cov_44_276475_g77_i0_p1_GENE_NODE_85_length_4430_cov_44_276475_g77_i0NODE_85_length_4430_cov_44_276475_g77_i0_p1_ORF_typecomplete_len389_score22_18DAGAT/PF03982_13/4_1e37_NODE_85_length_4430_cov_44_276475_g77_i021733339